MHSHHKKFSETTEFSETHMKNHFIIGGGPTGCYLAYQLLNQTNTRVFLFEKRALDRPQVIRIPFDIAQRLPDPIKEIMWADEETRLRLFSIHEANNSDFWPTPEYCYWPWISIGLFQKSMIHFLQNHSEYHNRFFFVSTHIDVEQIHIQSEIEKIFPIDYLSVITNLTAIHCTCGTYAQFLRRELMLLDGKLSEPKGHGIYLIYQNQEAEDYHRQEGIISYAKLGEQGISYAASNNCNYDVQLYTYPAGALSTIFEEIPDDFIHHAQFNSISNALDMTGKGLSEDSKKWLDNYKNIILTETSKAGIKLPSDLTQIKLFYAARSEYYWHVVATKRMWLKKEMNVPIFFLGDSAGSTDYKFGLSVGRGLLAVDFLIHSMQHHHDDFDSIILNYQRYWNQVLFREFNNGPLLSIEPWIQYQYLIKGRKVKFSDNQFIQYHHNEQYENYLGEHQHLSEKFPKTSEASAIIFINTNAIKHNLDNIILFGKKCAKSKIMGVVKSNGYGLGATLVADIAIESGIDFLAVAKLQEAVALRHAGIPHRIRLMTFEVPMIHDLNTYSTNQIEMVLPASKGASSVKMIAKWLQNKLRVIHYKLKVHIMIDTGLRRDGGYTNNLPESVLETIMAIQYLDSNQVEFAGISTHLACYRCTDYKGEELVNFRALQFQRLTAVTTFLVLKGINIPLIHIGGGLALLAEKWPLQFEAIATKFNISLYTRVGHGLYGMELQRELHVDSPRLQPVVQMNLQVRNVFYVEEGEPVSYGGYWRAPKNGVWIATLAGGWAEGIPRTVQTLGAWDEGMRVSINDNQYPVVGKINMNAMMVNLGSITDIKPGDRAIIFGWRAHEPMLNDLAQLSGQIGPSITVNIPASMPRIKISETLFVR